MKIIDLRYIQELLGHKHRKTTEIYTHVSMHSLQKIKSPFDDFLKKVNPENGSKKQCQLHNISIWQENMCIFVAPISKLAVIL